MMSSSSSSSSGDDELNVQIPNPNEPQPITYFLPGDHHDYEHDWEYEQHGGQPYVRVIPERFLSDEDDIFMRSMYQNYALEEKTPTTETDPGGEPTGKFWLNRMAAFAAAKEVLATHKGLTGAALDKYLATYFDKAWNHFDVNQTGRFEVIKAPQFMRFLASDQYMSLLPY